MSAARTGEADLPVRGLRQPDTPVLTVDLDRLRANIERVQAALEARGVALRPHAKTHKSVRVARLQLEAGARGLTVGTLGEAEVFAAAGIDDLFVAYPVWAAGPKAARLRALHDAFPSLSVGVDSPEGAGALAAAVAGGRAALRVLIEVDPGDHRTGVPTAERAVAVADVARRAGLRVEGVFAHGGHGYGPGAADAAGEDEVRTLTSAAEALESAGFEVRVVSAGSTPTMLAAARGRVTEVRAGTYVFGDRQQWALGAIPAEGVAATVAATVVSVSDDRLVMDAGAKSLTKERPDWLAGHGTVVGDGGLLIERLSDYHGVLRRPGGTHGRKVGELLAIVPNHVCPVVDLFDAFTVVGAGLTQEVWPVDARGRSR